MELLKIFVHFKLLIKTLHLDKKSPLAVASRMSEALKKAVGTAETLS